VSLECLKGYCQQADDTEAVCCIAKIHVDPWDNILIDISFKVPGSSADFNNIAIAFVIQAFY
jgi:hypothetical protein